MNIMGVSRRYTEWYWKLGKLLTSFSWNLLKAKNLYLLSKCKSNRLSINNCVVLSMLVAEIKWKQMNFTCQNELVFVFLSCILGRVRNAGLPVMTGNTLLAVACEFCRRAPSDFGCLRGSRVQPRQGSDSSRRARDTAATILDHSRHRGESATKTVKFFAAQTVNCVICKNLTRIDWMLLNFTPVIQQNCHQPGRNFEKTFCAVDRLSCQIRNQPIQKRTSFWYRKLCAFSLLIWGLNVVLRYLTNSDFCVAEILYVPESFRYWQHHSNYQITTRLFHILQDIPCDLFVLIFVKLSTENELWVLKYTIIHHFLENGTKF